MQKLNAREYYVIVLMAIISIILTFLLIRELFSQSSPLVTSSTGEFVNTSKGYIINIGQSLLQAILAIVAFVFLLMRRAAGWIAAFALLTLYTFLVFYVLSKALFAGIFDAMVMAGSGFAIAFLLALIFLIVPSTLKKFRVTRWSIIPVVFILALLLTFSYLTYE